MQTEYSLWTRDVEAEVLPTLRALGIGLVAYSPLGRCFLTGQTTSPDDLAEDDWRRHNPRSRARTSNATWTSSRRSVTWPTTANHKGVTPAQLALTCVLAQRDDIVPIPGTTRPHRVEENVGALDVVLTSDDVAASTGSPRSVSRPARGTPSRDGGSRDLIWGQSAPGRCDPSPAPRTHPFWGPRRWM